VVYQGDLHDYLDRKRKFDALTAVKFAVNIARGMNCLHQHKPDPIVHHDLKPRDMLLHEAGYLKVADFGLGKLLDASEASKQYAMTGETGSYRYMAPEVFLHKAYDKSVDVFSFAIIVHEVWKIAVATRRAFIEKARRPIYSISGCQGGPKVTKTKFLLAKVITFLTAVKF
jgi:serine/threonine protein kinase